MSGLLGGDPASCSQLGGSMRRIASDLRDDADRAGHGFEALRASWGGAASARARRRAETLGAVVRGTADELDRAGAALQAHASDLAEVSRSLRDIMVRAHDAGHDVVDGEVLPAWGVVGLADSARDAGREHQRGSLQRELDVLTAQLARRQGRLAAMAQEAARSLAEQSRRLRLTGA
jgi:hypothetical protein